MKKLLLSSIVALIAVSCTKTGYVNLTITGDHVDVLPQWPVTMHSYRPRLLYAFTQGSFPYCPAAASTVLVQYAGVSYTLTVPPNEPTGYLLPSSIGLPDTPLVNTPARIWQASNPEVVLKY